MFCPKCGSGLRSDSLRCPNCGKELPIDMLLSEAQTGEEKLEYFETLPRAGDGLCSDRKCHCDEVPITHGTGYLYVSKETIEFRRDARTLDDLQKKLQRMEEQSNYFIIVDPELASGMLVCEQGAKLRNLDLEIAGADARRWWENGLIPLRPTPRSDEAERHAELPLEGLTQEPKKSGVMSGRGDPASPQSLESPSQVIASSGRQKTNENDCWFCNQRRADPGAAIRAILYDAGHIREHPVTIARCAACKRVHKRQDYAGYLIVAFVLGAALTLAALAGFSANGDLGAGIFVFYITALVVGTIVHRRQLMWERSSGIRNLGQVKEHDYVRTVMNQFGLDYIAFKNVKKPD